MNIDKLRGLMAENGEKQKDLADVLNVSINTVRLKLKGKNDFKSTEIIKLCEHYRVEANYFFNRV